MKSHLLFILIMILVSCSKKSDPQPVNCWRCHGIMIYQTTQNSASVEEWNETLCYSDEDIRRYEDRNYANDQAGHFFRSVTCLKE